MSGSEPHHPFGRTISCVYPAIRIRRTISPWETSHNNSTDTPDPGCCPVCVSAKNGHSILLDISNGVSHRGATRHRNLPSQAHSLRSQSVDWTRRRVERKFERRTSTMRRQYRGRNVGEYDWLNEKNVLQHGALKANTYTEGGNNHTNPPCRLD